MRILFFAGMILVGICAEAWDNQPRETSLAVVNMTDEVFTKAAYSEDIRAVQVMGRQRKIQEALGNLGCEDIRVMPASYRQASESGIIFRLYGTGCKVQNKEGETCESGFEAQDFPPGMGLDTHKACVKSKPAAKPVSTKTGNGKS